MKISFLLDLEKVQYQSDRGGTKPIQKIIDPVI